MREGNNKFLKIRDYRVRDSFFSPLQELVSTVMLPYQEKVLKDEVPGVEKSHAVANFKIAAGLSDEPYYGKVFQDSDLAKWLEAVAYSLIVHPDPALKKSADEVIGYIEKAQREDGYLDTYFIINAPEKRWTNLTDCHEMYCAGHMTEAAVAYFDATGDDTLLNVCRRLCDHIDNRFGPGKITGIPGHEEIEIALMRLYQTTGEERYMKLASYFINQRGQDPMFFKTEQVERDWERTDFYANQSPTYMQNHAPVREQKTVEGHAVRCMYLLTGMAKVASATGDESLLTACRTLWDNMVNRRMYITGGIGSTIDGEAFTIDYDLPNDTCYTETCASVGVCFAAKGMLENEINSRYADILERELYNGTISGMQQNGKQFFYVNPLEVVPGVSEELFGYRHVMKQRPGWYQCACCPPNLARLLCSVGTYAWSEEDDTVYNHLFIGGTACFESHCAKIDLDTDYPRTGEIKYTVHTASPVSFTLAIRKPGWCRQETVRLNGEIIRPELIDGYYRVHGPFREGDTVTYSLEMAVRRVYANPKVRADAGCAAYMRGPLVYAFESTDNGAGLQSIRIPDSAPVRALPYDAQLLKGIVPLEVEGLRMLSDDSLYQTEPPREVPVLLKAIPYYAWGNRGECEMRVWMHR